MRANQATRPKGKRPKRRGISLCIWVPEAAALELRGRAVQAGCSMSSLVRAAMNLVVEG